MSQFASPASATGIDWADLNGRLLIFTVTEVVKDINTNFGTTDAVRATVTVVDGPEAGTEHTDTLVFPRVLKSQLAPNVGKQVLGRLGQGVAKPSQSAPWILQEATEEDIKQASEFIAGQLSADDI